MAVGNHNLVMSGSTGFTQLSWGVFGGRNSSHIHSILFYLDLPNDDDDDDDDDDGGDDDDNDDVTCHELKMVMWHRTGHW